MPLTEEQEQLEFEARMAQMRADTDLKREQARWEPWKVIISAAAVAGTFAGVLGYFIGLLQHH